MFSTKHIFQFILLFILLVLPVSATFVSISDEAVVALLVATAVVDCLFNRRWRSYTVLWVVMGVMLFYVGYTLTFKSYNTAPYVLLDALLSPKPMLAFAVMVGAGITFDDLDKRVVRWLCIVGLCLMCLVMAGGFKVQKAVCGHPCDAGMTVYLYVMAFLAVTVDGQGRWLRRDMALAVAWLCVGLLCTRAKYYAEFVLTLFFLLLYRPRMIKNLTVSRVVGLAALCLIIVAVVWRKFSYYYITGNSDTFDPNVMESYARPVLYAASGLILVDHFPFGSGLASFASYASEANYSGLYYEYGLDTIHGLSPSFSSFICDAYYASLAQFGVVGIALFIGFFRYAYVRLRLLVRSADRRCTALFRVGVPLMLSMLIECTSGNTFIKPFGVLALMLLGMICCQAAKAKTAGAAKAEAAGDAAATPSPGPATETKRIKI